MKILKKLLIFILIVSVIAIILLLFIGYNHYSNAIREESLELRVKEITQMENFVAFEDLSKDYVNAVVAVEDHRYYEHGAIDPIAIARALWINLKNFELQEGGSTITQQLAKNIVFSQEETVERKMGELFAAYDLEENYSKDEILALYVNSSYFGDGYYGIYSASMGYYNKEPKDLTLDEASMLAGIPNAPSVYSPNINPDLALKRQEHVLNKMVEYGYITEEQANTILE